MRPEMELMTSSVALFLSKLTIFPFPLCYKYVESQHCAVQDQPQERCYSSATPHAHDHDDYGVLVQYARAANMPLLGGERNPAAASKVRAAG